MNKSWLYSEERMELRADALGTLLKRFGTGRIDQELYSTEDIYNCAHDWVSQGNPSTAGIEDFFIKTYL
ncbi:hypothetical protein [Synechococcus phage S-B68]|nr:hypothetical protein [Synechococcus phage S-B68]